jgi:hypothetical protein
MVRARSARILAALGNARSDVSGSLKSLGHWAVSSEATVSLINHIVGAISRAKKLGRA